MSPADFYDWQSQSRTFASLSAYASWPMNLTNVDEPRRLDTQLVSANLFSTLGVDALMGRTFAAGEDKEESRPVVVLSHHLWRSLGSPSGIVGAQMTLNGTPTAVVGVMPAGFAFPSLQTDAWVPLSLSADNRASREGRWLSVIGRLQPHVRRGQAAAELSTIARRLELSYPQTNSGWGARLVSLHEEVVGKSHVLLWALQAGAFLLLLITCANLANLLLAKGAARAHEFGVRAALGAGNARLVRQLIVESGLLALLGGALGFAIAAAGTRLLRALGEGLIPRAESIHVSGTVALFALGSTILTVFIFGIAPSIHLTKQPEL